MFSFHRSLSAGVLSIKLRHFLCVFAKINSGRRCTKGGLRKEEVINSLLRPSSRSRSGVKSPSISKMQFHKHPLYPCMCWRHDEMWTCPKHQQNLLLCDGDEGMSEESQMLHICAYLIFMCHFNLIYWSDYYLHAITSEMHTNTR